MVKLDLKINSRVEVVYDNVVYKSLIQDVKKDEIIISIPVVDGIYLTINTRDEIEQYYYDKYNNIYKYKCKIIGRLVENNMSFYRLSIPYNIEKIQRRDYVRVDILNEISYISAKALDTSDVKKGLILDLSGGGAKIKIKDRLEKNEVILISISLEGFNLSIKGKIIRADLTEDKDYICGVSFFGLEDSIKEKIIRLVFTIMRKQRELL